MIYARSRGSVLRFVALAAALASVCGAVAAALSLLLHASASLVALPAGLATGGYAVAVWIGIRARSWTGSRLCLFRDRMLVVEGRRLTPVLWERIETATLMGAAAGRWAVAGAKGLRLGEQLTVVMSGRRSVIFKPRAFGLDPGSCRDLILRYRDDASARERLPEFDSALDLRGRPVQAGELRRSLR